MENESNPQETNDEVLTEEECAKRFKVRRETLYAWRHLPPGKAMPFVPLSDGPKPDIRYVWADVLAWFRSRSRNLAPEPAKRGRPTNIERAARKRDDGRSA